MSTVPGSLTATGLQIELIPDIRAALDANIRAQFGASLPLGDSTLLGHINGIIAAELGLLWQRLQQVYANFDPNQATGPGLDQLCLLTGTLRAPATYTTGNVYLAGNNGTVIPSGTLVATASTGAVFALSPAATLATVSVWSGNTNYVVNQVVSNGGSAYVCTTAGASAGSGGPTGTGTSIADGTCIWRFVGTGTAVAQATATAVIAGPTTAVAGDLSAIQTQISGWNTVLNIVDAVIGFNADTDQGLRIRRSAELAGSGSCTKDALRAQILKISGVTACTVYVNRSQLTSSIGLPPFSLSALVVGASATNAQQIVDTIANNLPMGIQTFGSSSGTHQDSQGTTETILYQTPGLVTAFFYIIVAYDPSLYALGGVGDAAIKTAIAAYGQGLATDVDVDPTAVATQAFTVPGVRSCLVLAYTDNVGVPAAWAPTTAYVATPGARSVVVNNGFYYICVQSGTSAGSGGPVGQGTSITDGGAKWYWLGNVVVVTPFQLANLQTSNMIVASAPVVDT